MSEDFSVVNGSVIPLNKDVAHEDSLAVELREIELFCILTCVARALDPRSVTLTRSEAEAIIDLLPRLREGIRWFQLNKTAG